MTNLPFIIENQEDSLLQDLNSVQTVSNIPVKVDKVLYDLSGTTIVGITGTIRIRGIKLRGVWDSMGNPLEFKKILTLNLRDNFVDVNDLFDGFPKEYFTLVKAKKA